jgi:recombination protein RecR
MIVAKDVDVEAVKKANVYNGLFFIIGGTLPFLEKNPSEFIRDRELIARITRDSEILREIIFALPVTPEGDNTRRHLIDSIKSPDLRISTFGRGLSTGTEIEYSDSDTIKSAFNNRA